MKALVFKGPHELAIEEREDPAPAEDDVVLRVIATGICGSDIHGFTGKTGRRHPGQVMGHEIAGSVVAMGGHVLDATLDPGPAPAVRPGEVVVNPFLGCGICVSCGAGDEQRCPDRRVIGIDAAVPGSFAYSSSDFRETTSWLTDQAATLEQLIDQVVSLDDAPKTFLELSRGEWRAGKVLVSPGGVGAR